MLAPLILPCTAACDLAAALGSGTDALVFDLGPGAEGREAARRIARDLLLRSAPGGPSRVVRVGSLRSGLLDDDLDAVLMGGGDAVMVPGVAGAVEVQQIAARLAVREAEAGIAAGRTGIVAGAADTARGVLALATLGGGPLAGNPLAGAGPRLLALAWDPRALAADLGTGVEAAPCRVARGLLVLAAAAAGVPALEGAGTGGPADLARDCGAARRDGFEGKMAREPNEVAAILSCFGPGGVRRGRRNPTDWPSAPPC